MVNCGLWDVPIVLFLFQRVLEKLTTEGKPRMNKIVVLGRRIIDTHSQNSEKEEEIGSTLTELRTKMNSLEKFVELCRIRYGHLLCFFNQGCVKIFLFYHVFLFFLEYLRLS